MKMVIEETVVCMNPLGVHEYVCMREVPREMLVDCSC